jgi:hypothetical protein
VSQKEVVTKGRDSKGGFQNGVEPMLSGSLSWAGSQVPELLVFRVALELEYSGSFGQLPFFGFEKAFQILNQQAECLITGLGTRTPGGY